MNSFREIIARLTQKKIDDLSDTTPLQTLLPQDRAAQGAFLGKLVETFQIDLKPEDIAMLTTLNQLEALIHYKQLVEGLRTRAVPNEYYSAAISLYAHYSTVRASLMAALLTIGAGFATYLFRYLQDIKGNNGILSIEVVIFLLGIQFVFSLASYMTSAWLAGLRSRTENFLLDLEAGKRIQKKEWGAQQPSNDSSQKNEEAFSPSDRVSDRYFHYLSGPSLGGLRKFRPHDWLDWGLAVVVVVLQAGVFYGAWVLYHC